MPNVNYQKKIILLVKKGEELRSQLSALKGRPISHDPVEARADILKCERFQEQIEENLKELEFTYYLMKAKEKM